jgi:hypothetical protein
MATVQFSYDGQLRRFVVQFIRMVSNFQVEFGQGDNGARTLQTVPVYYGDVSRQAAMILKNNSENTLNAVPAMAVYIGGLEYDRGRVLNPSFEDNVRVREQVYDQTTQQYIGSNDGLYSIERMMPAPYKLTIKLDIWTSNTEQKHQLIEQLLPIFNPGLEIQSSDNYLDWSSLSVVFLTGVNYTSRTVPMMGDDSSIDVASLTFEMPIWLNLPAKVKKAGVVTQIIANMYAPEGGLNVDVVTTLKGLVSQQRFTPMNYELAYLGNTLTLYNAGVNNSNGQITGSPAHWSDLVNLYGKLTNGVSQVRLNFEHSDGMHEIVGTVAYDPTDATSLLFTPIAGTLPANTLAPVNAIIDPYNVKVDSNILSPATGTRYLILNPIGDVTTGPAPAWAGEAGTNLIAKANDIIEWNGSYWTVAFDSSDLAIQYVTNLNTTVQYLWNGTAWVKSYEGVYTSGMWSLVL